MGDRTFVRTVPGPPHLEQDSPAEGLSDAAAWDQFLQESSLGQFQQSSAWASSKSHAWHCDRLVLRDRAVVHGGFQLLWRNSRLGRVGYVSKGPVPDADRIERWDELISRLKESVVRLRLRAVVVQPPDYSGSGSEALVRHGFSRNLLHSVIEGTWLVDLQHDLTQVQAQLRTDTRQNIRASRRTGIVVRQGDRGDLSSFHRMMRAMCARLGVSPNPSSEAELDALYVPFSKIGLVDLLIAELGAEPVGGLLLFRFAGRITSWKQACDPTRVHRRPDALLYYEAMRHAIAAGCHTFDFASFDSRAASQWASGHRLDRRGLNSRDFFHVGFGGRAIALPPAMVWFPSRTVRRTYAAALRIRRLVRPKLGPAAGLCHTSHEERRGSKNSVTANREIRRRPLQPCDSSP